MVRLIHTADLHLGLRRYGFDRLDDFSFTLSRFVTAAKEHEADAAIFAGDIFDTRRPDPKALAVLTGAVAHLRDAGIYVIIVPGNHDGASAIADPASHTFRWMHQLAMPGVVVFTEPRQMVITDTRSGPLQVAALPYPHKRAFDLLHPELPVEQRIEAVGRAVDMLIEDFAARRDVSIPSIFVGHLSMAGAALGSEQAMRMDWDAVARADTLWPFDFAALGHIHRQQQVNEKAWYAGSPDYHIFEDYPQRKGFVLAEVQPGVLPATLVRSSEPRPMVTLRIAQAEDGSFTVDPDAFAAMRTSPLVRAVLECHVRPTPDQQWRVRATLSAMGAPYVQVVVELAQQEDRAARVALAPDTADEKLLEAFLTANDLPTEPALSVGRQLIAEATTPAA